MDQDEGSDKMLPMSVDTDTSADSAFEPTIDELVNDFDDEQTLREEEALAEKEEWRNPLDEIEALKEESEMPLEELLAKYAVPGPALAPENEPPRKRIKPSSGHKKHNKTKNKIKTSKSNDHSETEKTSTTVTDEKDEKEEESPAVEHMNGQATDSIPIECCDEIAEETAETKTQDGDRENETLPEENPENDTGLNSQEKVKIRRSHLFELYPDQNFDAAIAAAHGGAVALEALYSEDEEEEDVEEEEETDPDYVKKSIMVGSAFQAVIPGLSQYGDVLPYENEDKLVWEPSQVSETEVEEYLLKIREIKQAINDDETINTGSTEKNGADSISNDVDMIAKASRQTASIQNDEQLKVQKENIKLNTSTSTTSDNDTGGVVKDNEQALHLLVQCGYDFKEALRRKRLNAVPLTGGTMSLWSEDECKKFEEGIQKFGKDFLKIRQNQVRTRTMRELVQFYYLWKKSERRDHNFANADTVDHMDIYLNEGEDYSSSPGSVPLTTASATAPCRKLNGCNQNNFSIMGNQASTSPTKVNNGNVGNKKRTLSDSNASNIQNSGNVKNNAGNNSDQLSTVPLQNAATGQPK